MYVNNEGHKMAFETPGTPLPLLAHEVPQLGNLQNGLIDHAAEAGVDVLYTHMPLVPIITSRRLQKAPGLAHVAKKPSEARQYLTQVVDALPGDKHAKGQFFSLGDVFVHEKAQGQTAIEGWVTAEPNAKKLIAEERALRSGLGMPEHWKTSGNYWVRLATLRPGGAQAVQEVITIINENFLGRYPLGSLVVGSLLDNATP